MFIVTHRKFFYAFSSILVLICLASVAIWGLNIGIDFKGGSTLQVEYPPASFPAQSVVGAQLTPLDVQAKIRPTGTAGYLISMVSLTQDQKIAVENALGIVTVSTSTAGTIVATSSADTLDPSSQMIVHLASSSDATSSPVATASVTSITETQFDSIGPVLGAEAARKAIVSILLVIAAIVLFIAYAFRKVSEPVSSWKYGLTAIIALVHNIIIPIGLFAILGHFKGYEVDTLFVTALLVVLGFSVHDNIVVFDRVRENLRHAPAKKPFAEVVGDSISQTFTRSVNTSLTTLLALVVLYFVGGSATQHFSLALIAGIAAGTYSSIFIGSPLLVTLEKMQVKKAALAKAAGKAGK
jgi:preprotein translocase subunit SecF